MKKGSLFVYAGRLVLLLVLVGCFALSGCGLKGDPIPDSSSEAFGFEELSAEMTVDGVLTFQGQISGASRNLDYLILEIQPVDDELCLGCPFLAVREEFQFCLCSCVSCRCVPLAAGGAQCFRRNFRDCERDPGGRQGQG